MNLYMVDLGHRQVGYCEPEAALVVAPDEWTARVACQRRLGGMNGTHHSGQDPAPDWTREDTDVEQVGVALPQVLEPVVLRVFYSSG